jgi:hypothetical protein
MFFWICFQSVLRRKAAAGYGYTVLPTIVEAGSGGNSAVAT